MPLEIREIGINMRVGDQCVPAETSGRSENSEFPQAEVVDECVRRVLAMLKTRQER